MTKHILLIGCGSWGKNILRDLKTLGCKVTVLTKSAEGRLNAQQFQADNIITQRAQIQDVGGVIVATLAFSHAAVIESINYLNVPVFVEKPMTVNSSEALKLEQMLGERLFVMHKWLYHEGVNLLADIINTQEFGKVVGIKTKRVTNYLPHQDVDITWTLMPHELTIIYKLLGYLPNPEKVVANEWNKEVVSMSILFTGTPWVISEISSISPVKASNITIECERAAMILNDGLDDYIQIIPKLNRNIRSNNLASGEKRYFPHKMPLLLELQEFINYLKGGNKPQSDIHQGIAVIALIEQLRAKAGIKNTGVLY